MGYILSSLNKASFVIAPVFWQVVYMATTFSVAALVFIAICRIFDNKIPPKVKGAVWGVMLAFLIMPLSLRIPGYISVMNWASEIPDISYRGRYDKVEQELFTATQDESIPAAEIEILEKQTDNLYIKSLVFDMALPLLWAAGVAVCAVYNTAAYVSLKRKIKYQCIPRPQYNTAFEKRKNILRCKTKAKVFTAPFVTSPSVFSVIQPVILLPEYTDGLTGEQQEYILLHETAHIKGGDMAVNGFINALACVYWFIPKLFVIIKTDMEAANDSYVIDRLEKGNITAYSKTLVQVLAESVNRKQPAGLISMAGEKTNMEKRIKLIKQADFFKRYSALFRVAGGIFAVLIWQMFFTGSIENTQTITLEVEDYFMTGELFDLDITYDADYITDANGDIQKSRFFTFTEFGPGRITVDSTIRDARVNRPDKYVQGFVDSRKKSNRFASVTDLITVNVNGRDIYYYIETMNVGDIVQGSGVYAFKVSKDYIVWGMINIGDPQQTDMPAVFGARFKDVRLKSKPGGAVVEVDDGNEEPGGNTVANYGKNKGERIFSIKVPGLKENWQTGMAPRDFDLWSEEGKGDNLPLSDVFITSIIYEVNGEERKPVGYIGYSEFTPYTQEISAEKYHETVWPSLRLGSFYNWNGFEPVKSDETGESGMVQIQYKNVTEIPNYPGAMASVPELESLGVLAYNKDLGVYVAVAFAPGVIDVRQAQQIAKGIKITEMKS